MARLALRVLALALLLSPLPAAAKCASPGMFLAPDAGPLPKNPSLHLFVPSWEKAPPELTVTDAEGTELPHRITALPSSKAFQVFRVDVDSRDAGELVVAWTRGETTTGNSYAIDRLPPRPLAPREAVRIESAEQESFQWSCSRNLTRNLSVSAAAPVYRVEWAAREAAFRNGERKEVILPHRITEMSFRWGEKTIPAEPLLKIGYLNCTGANLEWEGSIWAAVVAIFPDGSETPLGDPTRIDAPDRNVDTRTKRQP